MKVDDKRLMLPAVSLDITDTQPNNIRKIIETLYILKSVCTQLDQALSALEPVNPGDSVQSNAPKQTPKFIFHDEEYVQFIEQKNLHAYSNVEKIEKLYAEKGYKINAYSDTDGHSTKAEKIVSAFKNRTIEHRKLKKQKLQLVDDMYHSKIREQANVLESIAKDYRENEINAVEKMKSLHDQDGDNQMELFDTALAATGTDGVE